MPPRYRSVRKPCPVIICDSDGLEATNETDASTLLAIPSGVLAVNNKSTSIEGMQSRRSRHRMTTEQLTLLEALYKENTHPTRQRKKEVAVELNV